MFESDDFDDICFDEALSTIDEINLKRDNSPTNVQTTNSDKDLKLENVATEKENTISNGNTRQNNTPFQNKTPRSFSFETHRRAKRKFPGPAGLLPDGSDESFTDKKNIILSSQSCNSSQNQVPMSIFDDGPWNIMNGDSANSKYSFPEFSIAHIKLQAISNKLVDHRTQLLAGVIQNIDCSLQDPSITIRDPSGEIQGTLHRDVWDVYNTYLIPHYSVILLKNTSILTTGTIIKKNYLNITLNNVVSIYCDFENSQIQKTDKQYLKYKDEVILKSNSIDSIDWYANKITVVRNLREPRVQLIDNFLINQNDSIEPKTKHTKRQQEENIAEHLLEGIDCNSFSDDF